MRLRLRFKWSTRYRQCSGCKACRIPRCVVTFNVCFAVSIPHRSILATSSVKTWVCLFFAPINEILRLSFATGVLVRTCVATFTDATKRCKNTCHRVLLRLTPTVHHAKSIPRFWLNETYIAPILIFPCSLATAGVRLRYSCRIPRLIGHKNCVAVFELPLRPHTFSK